MSRRTLPFLAPLFAACLAVALCLPASADPSPAPPAVPEKIIRMDVFAGDLHAVLSTLERQTHVQVRVQDGKTPFKPVYVHLEDATLIKALNTIAQSAGASVTRGADGVYVFTLSDGSVPPPSPSPPDAGPRQVQTSAVFAIASIADVDNLGINFDAIPLPALPGSKERFLEYAAGGIAAQLLHTLNYNHHAISLPLITAPNNVLTTTQFTTTIPNIPGLPAMEANNTLTLQTELKLKPRINSDDTITLEVTPGINGYTGKKSSAISSMDHHYFTMPRTVRSGDTLVIVGWQVQPSTPANNGDAILLGIPSSKGQNSPGNIPSSGPALLLFITPTIIGESTDHTKANTNGGQSVTVTP